MICQQASCSRRKVGPPAHSPAILLTPFVACAPDEALARTIQEMLVSARVKVYTSTGANPRALVSLISPSAPRKDVVGVEVGGALKNIYAIGAVRFAFALAVR